MLQYFLIFEKNKIIRDIYRYKIINKYIKYLYKLSEKYN